MVLQMVTPSYSLMNIFKETEAYTFPKQAMIPEDLAFLSDYFKVGDGQFFKTYITTYPFQAKVKVKVGTFWFKVTTKVLSESSQWTTYWR